MNSSRFRTSMIALLVVSASAVTGIGLGRFVTKELHASDKPKARAGRTTAATANRNTPVGNPGNRMSPSDLAAAQGLRIIYPNPRDLFPDRGDGAINPREIVHNVVSASIPTFTLPVTAYNGTTYTPLLVGRDPTLRGKTTTTIPIQIIPLTITINNGGGDVVVYDPTVPDPCVKIGAVPTGLTDVEVVTQSPLFTNNPWTMNGINVGNTQYIDAFQRSEFWSLVGGSNYHLILNPITLPAQALSFGSGGTSGPGTNYTASSLVAGKCGNLGVVNINDLDFAVNALMAGPLLGLVNPGTVPIFVTKNVVSAFSGTSVFSNCCILGYHSAFTSGGSFQTYSPASIDTTGLFGSGYTGTLSHELGELINDPDVRTNVGLTPVWGNIGQVFGSCQNNFEVGDPLSPNPNTPTNPFSVVGGNGLTYKLQELAHFGWFYGGNSPGGSGGKFSNNGTLLGRGKLCPPGGTF